MNKLIIMAFLMFAPLLLAPNLEASELPDYLYSKGGVIYPSTGDSTQVIFRTQPEVMEYLKPGMLVGVLPTDCNSVSHGSVGEVFICHYDLVLKPEEKNGETVYRVITLD
jgi:hypothetical protein